MLPDIPKVQVFGATSRSVAHDMLDDHRIWRQSDKCQCFLWCQDMHLLTLTVKGVPWPVGLVKCLYVYIFLRYYCQPKQTSQRSQCQNKTPFLNDNRLDSRLVEKQTDLLF